MADNLEMNLDGDGSSYFQKAVVLRDWWLIKCSKEFNGKRFGVAGTEFTPSVDEKRAMRVFISSPIIKAYDVFTLEASNGTSIVLRGFLNKERVVKSGFNLEISREFVFGFPPNWEKICNNCFEGIPLSNDTNTVPSSIIIDKASFSVLSPCKNTKRNVEDSVAENRDKNTVTETDKVEPTIHTTEDEREVEKSKNATKEQRKGEVKVTKELDKRSKSRKKKSKKTRKSKRNVVVTERMNHSRSEVKQAEKILVNGKNREED